MAQQRPIKSLIPKTKEHFNSMVHKVNTEKLRDMLREKCRIRIRESRHTKFNSSRQFWESEKQWMTDFLKDELREFEYDIELEDIVLKEIIEEQYQWMIEQFEQSSDFDSDLDPTTLQVMCPICQVTVLKFDNHLLLCSCGYQQMYKGSLEDYWKLIQSHISKHEEKCLSRLRFFMDTNESALNIICTDCDFISVVE